MHIRRRGKGVENENVIGIKDDLREGRERKVGNIIDVDEKETWSKNGSLRYTGGDRKGGRGGTIHNFRDRLRRYELARCKRG